MNVAYSHDISSTGGRAYISLGHMEWISFNISTPITRHFIATKSLRLAQSSDWIASKISSWVDIYFYHIPVSNFEEDREVVDNKRSVNTLDREFLVSIRTASLPLCEGIEFWREPYYSSWFARQFEYDQAVPITLLDVIKVERAYGTCPVH